MQSGNVKPSPCTTYKNSLKVHQRPKCKPKCIKHLGEKHRIKLHGVGCHDNFLDRAPKLQATKGQTEKQDYRK